MAIATGQFEHVAAAVTARTAELLGARVAVVDDVGMVVASSRPNTVGLPLDGASREPDAAYLRVPLQLERQCGEVVVAEPPSGEAISPRLAQVLVELIINQTAVIARLPNQNELKDKFIHDLLHGEGGDEADIVREGQILGMDLSRPRAVVLINAEDFIMPPRSDGHPFIDEAQVRRQAQLVIASVVGFFNLPDDTICAYIGNGEVAVLKASSNQDLSAWTARGDGMDQASPSWANLVALKRAATSLLRWLQRDLKTPLNIGIGRFHPGLHGLAHSYEDARAALALGRRFHGDNRVHCLDGLGVAAFVGLADERTKIELASHLLSPLNQEPELVETLDAFFAEDCCPSSASKRLFIHRNTLSYRLDKIASFTGLDPRRFDDAVQIRLALVLRTLRAAA